LLDFIFNEASNAVVVVVVLLFLVTDVNDTKTATEKTNAMTTKTDRALLTLDMLLLVRPIFFEAPMLRPIGAMVVSLSSSTVRGSS
jgi:hypothetical protein